MEGKIKTKTSVIIVISLTIILLSAPFSHETKAENQTQPKNLDIILILDNSGSMNDYTYDKNNERSNNTKWEDALSASSEFIDQLRDGDRCAVFCFENNENYTSNGENLWGSDKPRKLTSFVHTTESGKNTLKNNLISLSPLYSTPLFDTIGDSMDFVIENKRSESIAVIVALTDGVDNVCYQFYPTHIYRDEEEVDQESINYYGSWGPSPNRYGLLQFTEASFIIGLDLNQSYHDIYRRQLENISNSSPNGTYYSVDESSELGAIYMLISQILDEERDSQNASSDVSENKKSNNEEKKKEIEFSEEQLFLLILIFTIIIVSLLIFVGFSLSKRK